MVAQRIGNNGTAVIRVVYGSVLLDFGRFHFHGIIATSTKELENDHAILVAQRFAPDIPLGLVPIPSCTCHVWSSRRTDRLAGDKPWCPCLPTPLQAQELLPEQRSGLTNLPLECSP